MYLNHNYLNIRGMLKVNPLAIACVCVRTDGTEREVAQISCLRLMEASDGNAFTAHKGPSSGLGEKEDRLRSLPIQLEIPHPVPTRSCQRGYRTIMVIDCFLEYSI